MKKSLLLGLIALPLLAVIYVENKPSHQYFELISKEFSSDHAYQTTAYVEKYWRVAGNPGFDSSIRYVEKSLIAAGYVLEEKAKKEDRLTYRVEKRAMSQPAWHPVSGKIQIEGDDALLLDFATNRNMICINSHSTPKAGIVAEVVSSKSPNVKGKIVYAAKGDYAAYRKAFYGGAIGMLRYNMPHYTKPEKHQNSIQFSGIQYQKRPFWGVMLSYQAKTRLEQAMRKGEVKLRVNLETKFTDAEELTVIAQVKGSELPQEEFVISAHVQEPGANDNASGVGVLTEVARVSAKLLKEKAIAPKRTLTFLWGDEIVSTDRYVKSHSKAIQWGMSLDMVGENTDVTGGSFLIEKMPDPSAIWTRGNDKHTEWGAGNVTEKDLFPHFFNDFALNRCLERAQASGWKVAVNPFEGGSDHTPFLNAGKPALLFWHFTDVFYHTDSDRLDKVSKSILQNVGISTLAVALMLTDGKQEIALQALNELVVAAEQRLDAEYTLSQKALEKGTSSSYHEKKILTAWIDWYVKAFKTVEEIPVKPNSALQKKISQATKKIKAKGAKLLSELSE